MQAMSARATRRCQLFVCFPLCGGVYRGPLGGNINPGLPENGMESTELNVPGEDAEKMGSIDAHWRWIIHGWPSWSASGVDGS